MPKMPDGRVLRSRYTMLKIGELSSVDNPAQPGALAAILKRADDEDEICTKIWAFTDAVTQSIRSAIGDNSLTGPEREEQIAKSISSLTAELEEISPKDAKQKESPMPKTVEQLEAENSELTSKLATANSALEAEQTAHGETKKALVAATDETIKVDDTEVRKSEVGEASFKVTKALLGRAEMATLEKRASQEFPHVVGTDTEKAQVLQAIDKMDDATKTAATAILTAAEKLAKGAFSLLGGNRGPSETETAKAAASSFEAEVSKHVGEGMRRTEAMSKVRREKPELFEQMQGADEAPASAQ